MLKRIAVVAATFAGAVALAPISHADTTVTQADWCSQHGGLVPIFAPFQGYTVCAQPGAVVGVFMAPPKAIKYAITDQYMGAYMVDPSDAFSDWIIPDGAQPAPPHVDPQIACDNIGPGGTDICNHEIWLRVMNGTE
jgi:hypothetical protein